MKTITAIFQNGLYWGIAFFALSFCIGWFNSSMPLQTILVISIPIGFLALVINGAMYSRFAKPLKVLERIEIKTDCRETVMIEAPANHLIGDDLISGKLCVTDKRLVFKTHLQKEFVWAKSELLEMDFYRSFKNNGGEFIIREAGNRKLMFEVDHLKLWEKALRKD